jgi:hypothetical protein
MDERDLERLLNRYADQLSDEELDAAIPAELRARLRAHVAREARASSRLLRAGLWSLGVAACLVLIAFLLVPRGPIKRFTITPEAVRAPSAEPSYYVVGLELNRLAYVRVVVVDARGERRLAPLDAAGTEFVKTKGANVRIDRVSRPDDPRGSAEVLFVLVTASPGSSPTARDLLQCIPEPVARPTEDRRAIARGLKRIAHDLEARFNCVVAFKPVSPG